MEHVIITERTVRIEAKGMVVGYHWGGEKDHIPKRVTGATIEEVHANAKRMMEIGSVNFKSFVGAILDPTIITTIEIEGEIYTNKNYDAGLIQIGDVTDEDIEFYISNF